MNPIEQLEAKISRLHTIVKDQDRKIEELLESKERDMSDKWAHLSGMVDQLKKLETAADALQRRMAVHIKHLQNIEEDIKTRTEDLAERVHA